MTARKPRVPELSERVAKTPNATDITVARMRIIAEEFAYLDVTEMVAITKVTISHAVAIFTGVFKECSGYTPGTIGFVVTYINGEDYNHIAYSEDEAELAAMKYNWFVESSIAPEKKRTTSRH